MINTPSVKVNIKIVGNVTKIDKESQAIEKEIADLTKSLAKDKTNKENLKNLEEKEKDLEAQEGRFANIEKSLGDDLGKVAARHKEIADELDRIEARRDLPESVEADLKKLKAINAGARRKDLESLKALEKKGELRSEPAKLDRLCDELEADVKEVNALEGPIEKAIDDEFAKKWEAVEKEVNGMLSADNVTPVAVAAPAKLKAEFEKLKRARWKDYDRAVGKFKDTMKADIAVAANLGKVNRQRTQFPTLNPRTKLNIIDKAGSAGTPFAEVEKSLNDALAKQRRPSKSQWAKYLGMTGYDCPGASSRFEQYAIHVTFDKNSWSEAAKQGEIDVSTQTADQILEDLFGTVHWSYQVHATIEIEYAPPPPNKYPHVYWGGHANHWDEVEAYQGKDAAWSKRAQAKLKEVLSGVKKNLRSLVQQVKDKDGDIPG